MSKNKKNIKDFLLKIFNFYNLKNLCILHGRVFRNVFQAISTWENGKIKTVITPKDPNGKVQHMDREIIDDELVQVTMIKPICTKWTLRFYYDLDESTFMLRGIRCVFKNTFCYENTLAIQNNPRWDATFCRVTSGGILSAHVPQKGTRLIRAKNVLRDQSHEIISDIFCQALIIEHGQEKKQQQHA